MFQDPNDQNFVSNKTISYQDLGKKKKHWHCTHGARTHAPHSAMQLVTVKSEMPLRNSLLHVAVINDLSTTY